MVIIFLDIAKRIRAKVLIKYRMKKKRTKPDHDDSSSVIMMSLSSIISELTPSCESDNIENCDNNK